MKSEPSAAQTNSTRGSVRVMLAREAYSVRAVKGVPMPRWKRFFVRVFSTLGDYPDEQAVHVVIADAYTGRVLASVSNEDQAPGEVRAAAERDLDALTAQQFAARWMA